MPPSGRADRQSDQAAFWRHAERTSFSVEAEDLLIDRLLTALAGNAPEHVGRYLDIGAFHPVYGSNSYIFYRRGWRGVCVDPNPEQAPEWAAYRPEDTFLNLGIAPEPGRLAYHRFSDATINGFFDERYVKYCEERGHEHSGSIDVECMGVKDFLRDHGGPVDFLSLDVETQEAPILNAWDWNLCRPKAICVEIHSRTIEAMMSSKVSQILNEAGYVPASRALQSTVFIGKEFLWS